MKATQFAAVVLLVQLSLGAQVSAQLPRSPSSRFRVNSRPAVSPYYDLIQQNHSGMDNFTFQYLRRVRPDVEFREAENRLQQNLNSLSNRLDESTSPTGLGATGHAASFLTHGKYFNVSGGNVGSQTAGRRFAGTLSGGGQFGRNMGSRSGGSRYGGQRR